MTRAENKNKQLTILVLLLTAIVAFRVPFLLGEVQGGDAAYHAQAAVVVLNGGLLYRDVPYTYPPLYAYTEALSIALLGNTSIGWKMVAQAYDIGLVVLIFLIVSRNFGQRKAFIASALYGFSPLPLIGTSIYACFDSAAAFWMLASILLVLNGKSVPSAVALGIGTAYKYFPLLLLIPLMMHLPGKRARILYVLTSIITVAVIQLPFALSDFSAWLYNVLLFHIERPASGATIYNLLSLHPTLFDVQTPLTVISPISLVLVFLLVVVDGGQSDQALLKRAALVMVTAVFFNKVVLFYSLWFIPLVCTFIVVQRKRQFIYALVSFVTLQVALLVTAYLYFATMTVDSTVLAMAYLYLLTSALLLLWLLRDPLLFIMRTLRRRKSNIKSSSFDT